MCWIRDQLSNRHLFPSLSSTFHSFLGSSSVSGAGDRNGEELRGSLVQKGKLGSKSPTAV